MSCFMSSRHYDSSTPYYRSTVTVTLYIPAGLIAEAGLVEVTVSSNTEERWTSCRVVRACQTSTNHGDCFIRRCGFTSVHHTVLCSLQCLALWDLLPFWSALGGFLSTRDSTRHPQAQRTCLNLQYTQYREKAKKEAFKTRRKMAWRLRRNNGR